MVILRPILSSHPVVQLENTNHYSSRKGRKIKDLPSLSHTLSKRRKKEFAKKTKIVRELFFDCLSRIWKGPHYPSATGPGDSVPSAFFFSFFPFFSFFSLGVKFFFIIL